VEDCLYQDPDECPDIDCEHNRKDEDLTKSRGPRHQMVWRVQNFRGLGPHHAEDEEAHGVGLQNVQEVPESQPIPDNDFADEHWLNHPKRRSLRFAFKRPEHATAWFGEEGMNRLNDLGYTLQQVPAHTVYDSKSGRQVAFLPAKTLRQMPPKEEAVCGFQHPTGFRCNKPATKRVTSGSGARWLVLGHVCEDHLDNYKRRLGAGSRARFEKVTQSGPVKKSEDLGKSELLDHHNPLERVFAVHTQPMSQNALVKAALDEDPDVRHAALKHVDPGTLRLLCAARRTRSGNPLGKQVVDYLTHPLATPRHALVALRAAKAGGDVEALQVAQEASKRWSP
jgi:hypothetical protein